MQPSESQSLPTPAPEPAAFDLARRIPAPAVRRLCGNVTAMTLHRWAKDARLNFPAPIYIGRRRYWREAEIIAWLNAREVAA